jgi:hypothetical protein
VNVRGREELEDGAHSMDLGDYDMINRVFQFVHVIHDLVDEHGGDFNDVQCRIFAGCERFITMNGGHSILCSYFGGENIIYSKECRELWPNVNSFYNWYPEFGGSTIKVVNTYADLERIVKEKWVIETPLINILVRCHNRERGLDRLYGSLKDQTHINWNVFSSYESPATWKYLKKYPFHKMKVGVRGQIPERPPGDEYARPLPANLYLNELAKQVKSGYVVYADDDDLLSKGALSLIAQHVEEDRVLLWRAVVDPGGRLIPSEENWKKIVAGDISGIAFAFHSKHLDKVNWEPWRRGDYRVIRDLCAQVQPKWLNIPLTIIGRAPSDKNTAAYMAEKKAEHMAKVARINEEVARKRAETSKGPQGA